MTTSRSPKGILVLTFVVIAIIFILAQRLLQNQIITSHEFGLPSVISPTVPAIPAATLSNLEKEDGGFKQAYPGQYMSDTPTGSFPSPPEPQIIPAPQDDVPAVANAKSYLQQVLDWPRPDHEDGHWPPYEEYVDKDYDPNRWEHFTRNPHYYKGNGIGGKHGTDHSATPEKVR